VNPRNQSFVVTFLLIVAAVAMVVMAVNKESTTQESLTINQVARDIKAGKVARVVIEDGDSLRVIYTDGDETGVESYKEADSTLVAQLLALGVTPEQLSPEEVTIEVKPPSQWAGVVSSALYILPVIFMAGVLWFIFRQAQGSNNAAMSFGKSRARMFSGEHPTVTFQDVAGVEESKQELAEVVEFEGTTKIYSIGRSYSQGRSARRTSGNRQDSFGESRIW
jgi:cell division protease FtsH